MFSINSYIQYKNTPSGTPRILSNITYEDWHYLYEQVAELIAYTNGEKKTIKVANKEDCRQLLSVEIDGVIFTEGDMVVHKIYGELGFVYADICSPHGLLNVYFHNFPTRRIALLPHLKNLYKKGSWFIGDNLYFSQPYIERQWRKYNEETKEWEGYSIEEAWELIFKLLNINNV